MRSNLHGARGLTHYQALLRELVQHGRVTYDELCARYPDFSLNGFRQAAALARPLGELADHGWRVFYDPGAEGRADLHPYTAGHEEYDTISARTLPELALTAWKSRQHEDSGPNMPDDVIDGLYLAGYDWNGTAWVRGFERINEDANLPELRYQLGLSDAPPPATVPMPADLARAGFSWTSAALPTIIHGASGWRCDAPTAELALDLARDRLATLQRPVPPRPQAPISGWRNVGVELADVQAAIDHHDQIAAVQAALRLAAALASPRIELLAADLADHEYEALAAYQHEESIRV